MNLGEFGDAPRAALVGELVEVDGEQRRRRADEDVALVMGIDLQHVGGNEILPAMVFKA
jgi:hypothetical protein